MDELLAQFLIEGPELVEQAAAALLRLERALDDHAALDEAFRAVHTLKGSAGLFDLPAMSALLHEAEDSLAAIRSGAAPDAVTISRVLAVVSQTEQWLQDIRRAGAVPQGGLSPARAPAPVARYSAADPAGAAPAWAADLLANAPPDTPPGDLVAIRYSPDPQAYFGGDDPVAIMGAAPGLCHLTLSLAAAPAEEPYDPFTCRLILEGLSSAAPDAVKAAFRFVQDQVALAPVHAAPGRAAAEAATRVAARALRVDIDRIDALAALAADLIAAKTALSAAAGEMQGLSGHVAAIDRLANQIHGGVMGLRMTAVEPMLRRFPRVVRDMADTLGKVVDVTVDDGGVEADKSIVDGLVEPLTHLLRNAVDHGVEAAEGRQGRGKPGAGQIRLSSRQAGGRLRITVSDDGRGIDPDAIRRAVAARDLMAGDRLVALSDAEVADLIFMPGLSTAERLTDISGRGVGMDAVRTALAAMDGRITVTSVVGQGTTFDLSLPLAISLTKVMVISDGDWRYGLPLDRVLETLRLPRQRIFPIRDGHAFDWRGKTAPLMRLWSQDDTALHAADQRVVVVRSGGQPVGLAVGRIEERLDVAMRPLEGLMAGMPGFAGTALLADGAVLMVIDTDGIGP